MEGTEEQLSGGMPLWEVICGGDDSNLSLLYPELSPDWFADNPDVLVPHQRKKPTVRPYIGRRDINNDKSKGEDNRPVPVWEIGVKVDF